MQITRAYKTRLIVNNKEATYLRQCADAARFVFNWALADRKARYEDGKQATNKFEQMSRFNELKKQQYPWLADYPSKSHEQAIKNVDRAFENFFRRIKRGETPGYPKFKSRNDPRQSFTVRCSIHAEPTRIRLPRIGWLRLAEHDYLPTGDVKILSATVSTEGHGWYVSVQVQETTPDPEPTDNPAIGVDLGIKQLAVCSDGKAFDNPRALIVAQRKIARLSRELSRRKKGSVNREKTKDKLARAHVHVAAIRRNAQHQVSRYVVDQEPQVVVIEDLHVKGMVKTHCLARAVSDSGFGEMRRQIKYKAEWAGIEVVVADRFFPSSKTCSACGCVRDELSLSERTFICPECGSVIDRDLNAAKNLAALANRQNGRGLPVELRCNNASL